MGVDFMNQLAPPTPEGFLKIHVYFVEVVCLWDIFWFEIIPYNRSTLNTHYNIYLLGGGASCNSVNHLRVRSIPLVCPQMPQFPFNHLRDIQQICLPKKWTFLPICFAKILIFLGENVVFFSTTKL